MSDVTPTTDASAKRNARATKMLGTGAAANAAKSINSQHSRLVAEEFKAMSDGTTDPTRV